MTGRTAAKQSPRRLPNAPATSSQAAARDIHDAIEVLPSKADGKHTITLQIRHTGAFFRIQPVRDPQQPRLWCVAVRLCSSGGMLEASKLGWVDRPGASRTEIADTIDAIRDDIAGWLATPTRHELCRWLLTAAPVPTPAEAAGLPQPSTARTQL